MGYGTKRIKHSAAHARHSGRVEREAFVNSVNGIVWEVALPAWTFTFVSPQAERILGYPLEHWFADTNFWSNHLHPEDRWVLERLRSLVTGECDDRRLEFRMIAADNRIVWFRDLVTVDVSDHGPAFMGGVLFDVTQHKKEEALHAGQMRVLETIAGSAPLPGVLTSIVELIEPQSDGLFCSILLLKEDGKHVTHGAAPNLPEAYIKAIDGAPIGPKAGSCGTAMFRRKHAGRRQLFRTRAMSLARLQCTTRSREVPGRRRLI